MIDTYYAWSFNTRVKFLENNASNSGSSLEKSCFFVPSKAAKYDRRAASQLVDMIGMIFVADC